MLIRRIVNTLGIIGILVFVSGVGIRIYIEVYAPVLLESQRIISGRLIGVGCTMVLISYALTFMLRSWALDAMKKGDLRPPDK